MASETIYTQNLKNATYVGTSGTITGTIQPVLGVSNVQVFASAGPATWIKPSSGTWVRVECIGGGGGGGWAGGGGGGGFSFALFPISTFPGPVAVVVGAGGAAPPNVSTPAPGFGQPGVNSTFNGTSVIGYAGGAGGTPAGGGGGGMAGAGTSGTPGAQGGGDGQPSPISADGVVFGGGGGGNGAGTANGGLSIYGGAGGGGSPAGTGGTSVFAGKGGDDNVPSPLGAGVSPGGGGGKQRVGASGSVRVFVF